MVSFFSDRAGSLVRGLRRTPAARRHRDQDRRLRLAIDQLESRVALAITTPLSIGVPGVPNVTSGGFLDVPTGPGLVSDFVSVVISGTRGTVVFTDSEGDPGVADGTNIQSIQILDASPDFQLTLSATVRTGSAVPYGSDGVIQLGTITTGNVIRGINTVKGPPTNTASLRPNIGFSSPVGFTQTAPGSNTLVLEGNYLGTFSVGNYVCATPLLSNTTVGAPSFGSVIDVSFDAPSNQTTLVFDNTTAAGTTAGALTFAEKIEPSFELTTFIGVNFSNRGLKEGGGIFVDRVLGAQTTFLGVDYGDVGILLTQGLLAYSSIGIRDELDAGIILGTTNTASADGRVFVESATSFAAGNGGRIVVGPQNSPTTKNSKFQLYGGAGDFDAAVTVLQAFDGVMNFRRDAAGPISFQRGVGPLAVLDARGWNSVGVVGDFAGRINSTLNDISLSVSGNLAPTARLNSASAVTLGVSGSILKGATISARGGAEMTVGRDLAGTIHSGKAALSGTVGGNVSGATLVSQDGLDLAVTGNMVDSWLEAHDASTLAVQGAMTRSSVTVAQGLELAVSGAVTNSSVVADSDLTGTVGGNVSKSRFISRVDLTSTVRGRVTDSLMSGAGVSLTVDRDALRTQVIGSDAYVSLDIGQNFSGKVQGGSAELHVGVGGSVLKGSTFLTGGNAEIDVDGNFDGTVAVAWLRFFVVGNVSKASRIVADRVTQWTGSGPNFSIGGRFDGIINVGIFDAAPLNTTVTVLGNGAGQSARFNVDRFETDTLVFNGNFRGNLRVGQDLVANLKFNGDVDRITVMGRIGSYALGNTLTPIVTVIEVTGRLLYLNSNSYFQPLLAGRNGTFWNDTNSAPFQQAITGTLLTGRYVTVVPLLQSVPQPAPPPSQTFSAPTAPLNFSATQTFGPAGFTVTFDAPTSDGGLPIVYYQYTTDGGANWRRFTNPAQGPSSTPIALPGPSTGGSVFAPAIYSIGVRAVNALGATPTAYQGFMT